MVELSDRLSEKVQRKIRADMRPSLLTIYLKCGLAVFLGGALSLLLCGQFGIGVEHALLHFGSHPHYHADDIASALGCGMIFALLPAFLLRLFSSAMQFRLITRSGYHAALVWMVGLGAVLAHHGDNAVEIMTFAVWAGAAMTTFFIVSRAIDRMAYRWIVPAFGKNR